VGVERVKGEGVERMGWVRREEGRKEGRKEGVLESLPA
jgi:hypothetical protein